MEKVDRDVPRVGNGSGNGSGNSGNVAVISEMTLLPTDDLLLLFFLEKKT